MILKRLDWKEDNIITKKLPDWEEKEHKKIEANPTFIQIVDNQGRMIFKTANYSHIIFI